MIRQGVVNLNQKRSNTRGQSFSIEKVFQHPSYSGTAYFDIAVLQIAPVKFNANLRPICLPDPSDFYFDRYDDRASTLIGWGSTDTTEKASSTLKRTVLTIYEYR